MYSSPEIEKLASEVRGLVKDKVAIVIDDMRIETHKRVSLFQKKCGIEAYGIKHTAELAPLVQRINNEGKEVFLIISDVKIGNERGEDLWKRIRNNEIPGLKPNVVFELHSGDEIDDIEHHKFSKTSPENDFEPFLKRMHDYLLRGFALAHSNGKAKEQSFEDQLEYARMFANSPYDLYSHRLVDHYIPDDRKYLEDLKRRTEWQEKYRKLATQAKNYGLEADPEGKNQPSP